MIKKKRNANINFQIRKSNKHNMDQRKKEKKWRRINGEFLGPNASKFLV